MCVWSIVISDTLSDLVRCFWPCSPEKLHIYGLRQMYWICVPEKSLVSSEVKGHE